MADLEGAIWRRGPAGIMVSRHSARKQVVLFSDLGSRAIAHAYFRSEDCAQEFMEVLDWVLLGNMSAGLAARLAEAGHPVAGFNAPEPPPVAASPVVPVPFRSSGCKLSDDEAREARELRLAGFSIRDLAAMFKVANSSMNYLLHGKTYRNAGGPIEPEHSARQFRSIFTGT